MAYDFKELKQQIEDTKAWLQKEYATLRTGRATPALLDGVRVEAYGNKQPLSQVASVTVEDARTLRVSVWDVSILKEVEKAVVDSDLGVSYAADEKGGRVSFPEVTSERRDALKKIVKEKLEDGRQTLRGKREDVWSDIQKQEKAGDISEDDKFKYKDDMQKIVDDGNKSLEEVAEKKEKELEG